MSILVSGSVALDHIMVFPDRFEKHILPDELHNLNVSFNIQSLETHFGGTGGNIAYVLRRLGEAPRVVATVGSDFGPYAEWMDRWQISRSGIHVLHDVRTPQGFVTSDEGGNQIWAFYEGSMARAHEARIEPVVDGATLAIVSSNGRRAMVEHARELKSRGIPTFIDPSHGLPILEPQEIVEMIEGCAAYVVNEYEWKKTLEQTGRTARQLVESCEAVIITHSERGSEIHTGGRVVAIPPVPARHEVDPTGCGDAYRAGVLYGRARDMDWEVAGRIGSLLGSAQVAVEGPQNAEFAPDAGNLADRFQEAFGFSL